MSQHAIPAGAEARQIYRAVPSSYIAMGWAWWFLLAISIVGSFVRSFEIMWPGLVISGGIGGFIHLWLAAFRLEFGDGWFRYRSLLQGEREVRFSEIDSVVFPTGKEMFADPLLPPYRYEVFVKSGDGLRRTVINTKPFSREALVRLRENFEPFLPPRRKSAPRRRKPRE